MPLVLSDDLAAALLTAFEATGAASLSPSFANLQTMLNSSVQNMATPEFRTSQAQNTSDSLPLQETFSSSTQCGPRSQALNLRPRASSLPSSLSRLPQNSVMFPSASVALHSQPSLSPSPSPSLGTLESPLSPLSPPSPPSPPSPLLTLGASSPTLCGTPSMLTAYQGDELSLLHAGFFPSLFPRLSPLRFEEDSRATPAPPSTKTSDKRTAAQFEEEDSYAQWCREEKEAQILRGSWTGAKIRIPSLETRTRMAGGSGGAGGGRPRADNCNRKGDKRRVGRDEDIGKMPCGKEGCESCNEGEEETQNNRQTGKRKRRNVGWRRDGISPPITQRAGELLTDLMSIFSISKRKALDKLLASPSSSNEDTVSDKNDIPSVVARIRSQTDSLHVSSLRYMLTLVQLALNVDSLAQDNQFKHLPKISQESLADRFAGETPRKTFVNWLNWGQRLLLLCAAGTMYILPVIAALEMRTKITGETSTEWDIISLANALREVKNGQWLPMVRRLMVPINSMQSHGGYLQGLHLTYNVPLPVGQPEKTEILTFNDVKKMDDTLDKVRTNVFVLPPRSAEWDAPSTVVWHRLKDPSAVQLPPVYKIQTPLQLQKTKSPLTKENRNRWTEEQRNIAMQAPVARNLTNLEALASDIHADGKLKPKSYVEINSSILDGHALYLADANDNFIALLFKVPEEYRQLLVNAIEHIHAVMPGELKDEDSRRKFFKYLACHYSWYARFGEKGKGAPTDAHANNIRKDHRGRVNFEQRLPHQSKEARDKPVEYYLLAEAYTDFFELLRVALKEYLPKAYDELHIWAESLPLGASSPAYPFGGFVINVNACSWAHRDEGDKIMCFVIPAGKFTGGQLALYEAGFSFNLQTGDVLAFPSCDFTHFNLHFKGVRTTLVLHSDRQGDAWVANRNGWSAHIVCHE